MENSDFTGYNARTLMDLRPGVLLLVHGIGLLRIREETGRRRERMRRAAGREIDGSHAVRQSLGCGVRGRSPLVALLLSPAQLVGRALRFLWRSITSPPAVAGSGKDKSKMKSNEAAARTKAPRQPRPDDSIVEHYEKQLQELRSAIEAGKREKALLEAWESRELMATLMEEGWLGLRLLAHLKFSSSPMSVRELAESSGMDVDCVAATAARLFRFGAADLQNRSFTCTDEGRKLLQNIEAGAGVDLTPEPESAGAPA